MLKNAKRSSSWKYQGRVEERKDSAPILASTSFHLHADASHVTFTPEPDDEPVAAPPPTSPAARETAARETAARETAAPAVRVEAGPSRQWPRHLATGAPQVRAFQANPRLFVPPIGIPANQGARAGTAGAAAGVADHLRPNVRSNAPVYTFGQHPGRRALSPPGVTAMAPAVGLARSSGAARVAGGVTSGAPPIAARIAAPKARPIKNGVGESGPRVYTYGTCQSCRDD